MDRAGGADEHESLVRDVERAGGGALVRLWPGRQLGLEGLAGDGGDEGEGDVLDRGEHELLGGQREGLRRRREQRPVYGGHGRGGAQGQFLARVGSLSRMEPDTDSAPTRRSARSRPSVPDEPQQRRSSSASLILEDAPTAQPRSDTLEPDDDEEEEEEDDAMDESKSEGELDAIHQEMQQLEQSIPNLSYSYKLVGRLGEGAHLESSTSTHKFSLGTFSSVYKALDLNHDLHDNSQWHTPAPSDAHRPGKVYVALKRIYVTSSPVRIFNELDILSDLR